MQEHMDQVRGGSLNLAQKKAMLNVYIGVSIFDLTLLSWQHRPIFIVSVELERVIKRIQDDYPRN